MPTNKYLHNIDLDQNELISPVLHKLDTAPSSAVDGQVYYNTTTKKVYYYNSTTSTWTEVGAVYNIYNLDGTLTGARVVTMGANSLTFQQGVYGSAGEFVIKGTSTNAAVVGVKFKSESATGYYSIYSATDYRVFTWNAAVSEIYVGTTNGSLYLNGNNIFSAGNVQYSGNLTSTGGAGNYTLSLRAGATVNDFAKITAYTNGSTLSTLQSLEFGYLATSVNSGYQYSNPAYVGWNFNLYGTITASATGGGTYSSLLVAPTLNVTGNSSGSTYYGIRIAPVETSTINVNVIPFSYSQIGATFTMSSVVVTNSKIVKFTNTGASGNWGGGYGFYGGYNGNNGSIAFRIFSNGPSDSNNAIVIGDLAEGGIQSATTRLAIKGRVATGSETAYEDVIAIYTQSSAYIKSGSKVFNGIIMGSGGAGLLPGSDNVATYAVAIGFQMDPLTNGWGSSLIVSAKNDSSVMGEVARFTGKYGNLLVGTTNDSGSYKIDAAGSIRGTALYASGVNMSVGDTTYAYSGTYGGASGVFQVLNAGSGNTQIILRPSTASITSYGADYWSYIQQGTNELFITGGNFQKFSLGSGIYKKLQLYNADANYNTYSQIVHVTNSNNLVVGTITGTPSVTLTPSNTGGSMITGTYYYRVTFVDWLGQNCTTSTDYSVTFGAGVTTGSVVVNVGNGNVNGAGIFGFNVFRQYVAPAATFNSIYTAKIGLPSNNTSVTDTGVNTGSWVVGTWDINQFVFNNGSVAGIRNDGYIYSKNVNTGAINFQDQSAIGATSDGITYALQYNAPQNNTTLYKTLGFKGDIRFGAGTTVASIYYFGARYSGNGTAYQVSNFMTFATPGDKIGVSSGLFNNTVTKMLNIVPDYNYTAGTGHTITGIHYQPNTTGNTGIANHYAFNAVTGDLYIQGGNVGFGTIPTASYRLEVSGTTKTTSLYTQSIVFNTGVDGRFVIDGLANGSLTGSGGNSTAGEVIIIGRYAGSSLTGSSNHSLILLGYGAGSNLTTGGLGCTFIGRNAGKGITTGVNNIIIGSTDASNLASATSNSLHLVPCGYEGNDASRMTGNATKSAFIGGGYNNALYLNDFYFGAGGYVIDPSLANLSFYAPSGAGTNLVGANFTINAGRGTGTGTPGDFIIATSTAGTTGTTVQTLTNRWWVKGGTGALSNVASPSSSAALQIDSTTQGFLPPRMLGTQAEAITNLVAGLIVYATSTGTTINSIGWWGYNGTTWKKLDN